MFIIILSVMEFIAMYNLKKYAETNQIIYILLGCTFYSIVAIVFSMALRTKYIADTNIYWNIMSTILSVGLGYYFGEYLTHNHILGILICVGGIYILNI